MRRVKPEQLQKASTETNDAIAELMVGIREHTDSLPEPVKQAAVRYFQAIEREVELEMAFEEMERERNDSESDADQSD